MRRCWPSSADTLLTSPLLVNVSLKVHAGPRKDTVKTHGINLLLHLQLLMLSHADAEPPAHCR